MRISRLQGLCYSEVIHKQEINILGRYGRQLKANSEQREGGSDVDDTVQSGQQASWLIRDTWVA